jgi:hypothetical protein
MTEGIKWERSGVRKTRLRARVDGKKLVIDLDYGGAKETFLQENGRRIAGCQWSNAEALLRTIADLHYVEGKEWRVALELAEAKLTRIVKGRAGSAS